MKATLVICGYGVGISEAVARRFGKEGYRVAVVARNQERLAAGVSALLAAGIEAKGYPADLGNADVVRRVMTDIQRDGAVQLLHWNAYSAAAGELMSASSDELSQVLATSVTGLVVAAQALRASLKETRGAILVTGGGLALYDKAVDAAAVGWKSAGLAVAKAAQHKLVGLLRETLAPDGIYVADVVVAALVKGTAFDRGNATLDPTVVADRFWTMVGARSPDSATLT